MVDERDAMLRELESEVRREQMAKLWDRYGIYAIVVAVLIVASVGGYKWWEARTLSAAAEAGARYQTAMQLVEQGKADEARQAFQDLVQNAPSGYATQEF